MTFRISGSQLLVGPLLAALVAGCTPISDTRGTFPTADLVKSIKVGVDTKAQVAQVLGSPSSVATFDDRTWYYIGTKTETYSFLAAEPIEQQVVRIRFDGSGTVSDIETKGLADAKPIEISDRVTPTAGHSLGLLEQLFGNIGRFSGNPVGGTNNKPPNTGG
jgi:outer membrane protein assembly factor BamE (lipoprotein component of BamABCDE complex)